MELAVDAAQSRKLPDFLQRFALRSTRMLEASLGRRYWYFAAAKPICTKLR